MSAKPAVPGWLAGICYQIELANAKGGMPRVASKFREQSS